MSAVHDLVRLLRRNLQLILGLAISGWSIWLLAQSVDITAVGEYLGRSSWPLLTICLLSVPVAMLVKAIRWRYLFAMQSAPQVPPLLSSLYIGYLMNTVLPARAGELVRAFLIGRQDGVGTPAALATIVLEKLLDLATLAIVLVVLILVVPLPDWVTPIAYASAAGLVGGFVGLALMLAARRPVLRLIVCLEQRSRLLARLRPSALADSFLDSLAGLGRREPLPALLCWSVLVWVGAAITLWTGILGVGIPTSLTAVLLVLVVTNIGMAVPSAPGYVGVFHYLVVISLQPFGVDPSHALGAAMIVHLIIFGNFILGGAWFLWRAGYTVSSLKSQVSSPKRAAPTPTPPPNLGYPPRDRDFGT
jgi:hypothetical protein